jgi:hypothetical protein
MPESPATVNVPAQVRHVPHPYTRDAWVFG